MIWFHLLVVLLFIIVGARLRGIGIGVAGAAGVIALPATGVPPATEHVPWDCLLYTSDAADDNAHTD